MESHARLLAASAALFVTSIAGCASAPSPSPAGLPASAPEAASSPPVAASPTTGAPPAAFECDDFTTGCAGTLSAGVHSSSKFTIPLTLSVPDGWVNVRDIARTYEVEPASSSGVPGHPDIEVLAMNAIPDQASCGPVPLAGAGSTVTDFVDFVSHHPGLDATAPAPVTIDGYDGQSIDFGVRSDWTAMCPDIDPVNPVALMLTSTNSDPPGRHLAYSRDVRVRWIVLDVAGETVIVELVAPAEQFDAVMTGEQAIIDSLDFTPGG